jgi:hypothetical protein
MTKLLITCLLITVLSNFPVKCVTTTAAPTASTASASLKIVNGWKTTTGTGYNGITADVYGISYDGSYVYISANSVPSYTIGPTWKANPNTPTAQAVTYK